MINFFPHCGSLGRVLVPLIISPISANNSVYEKYLRRNIHQCNYKGLDLIGVPQNHIIDLGIPEMYDIHQMCLCKPSYIIQHTLES